MRALVKSLYRTYCGASERSMLRRQARAAEEKLASFSRPYKLHLGCGRVRFEGWINIDSDSSLGETADIVWDIARGIPVEDSSCALVYSEHLLEHFGVEQGVALLKDCRRILQPNGMLRIAMPSLDVLIEKSHNGNWRDQDWLTWPEYRFVQTRAEMLNLSFRWWGHQWLYDREELHSRLREAGFLTIEDVEWGESNITGLRGLETRKDSLLICEARS